MRAIVPLLLAALVTACAGQVSEPSYYLLRPDSGFETRPLQPSENYALGTVSIASYLDQPGMILETAEGNTRAARQHLWAEPVYESVRNYLAHEISRALGEDLLPQAGAAGRQPIHVRIDRLHGTHDGEAVLVAHWWLGDNEAITSAYQFAERRPLDSSGYAALARAEEALLTDLAREIAARLSIRSAGE